MYSVNNRHMPIFLIERWNNPYLQKRKILFFEHLVGTENGSYANFHVFISSRINTEIRFVCLQHRNWNSPKVQRFQCSIQMLLIERLYNGNIRYAIFRFRTFRLRSPQVSLFIGFISTGHAWIVCRFCIFPTVDYCPTAKGRAIRFSVFHRGLTCDQWWIVVSETCDLLLRIAIKLIEWYICDAIWQAHIYFPPFSIFFTAISNVTRNLHSSKINSERGQL